MQRDASLDCPFRPRFLSLLSPHRSPLSHPLHNNNNINASSTTIQRQQTLSPAALTGANHPTTGPLGRRPLPPHAPPPPLTSSASWPSRTAAHAPAHAPAIPQRDTQHTHTHTLARVPRAKGARTRLNSTQTPSRTRRRRHFCHHLAVAPSPNAAQNGLHHRPHAPPPPSPPPRLLPALLAIAASALR